MKKEKNSQVKTKKQNESFQKIDYYSQLKNFKIYKNKNKNENLKQNEKTILSLQDFLYNLYNYKWKLINDKKFINTSKTWLVMNSQDLTIYESVITYFINSLLENEKKWKQVNFNIDFIEKKVKYYFLSNKEKNDLNDNTSFSIKSIKSNFIENFNNKFIIDYIQENENITTWKLEILKKLLNEIENLKKLQKEKIVILKEKYIDNKKEYQKQYKVIFKSYNNEYKKVKQKIEKLHLYNKYKFLLEI